MLPQYDGASPDWLAKAEKFNEKAGKAVDTLLTVAGRLKDAVDNTDGNTVANVLQEIELAKIDRATNAEFLVGLWPERAELLGQVAAEFEAQRAQAEESQSTV